MSAAHPIHWPPLAIVVTLAALTWWLNQLGGKLPTMVDTAGFTHDPDYYVVDFDVLVFDPHGQPRHRLRAAHMIHYMDDDTTVLEAPIYSAGLPDGDLEVQARRALLSADNRHVYFLDDVHARRTSAGARAPLSMRTEFLHVTPEARMLRTNRPVTLTQGPSRIDAHSLYLDGNAQTLTLGGGVRGVYETAR